MHPRALILNQQGFSLAETAIALAVIAVVIGLMVPTLLSVRVAEQARATTQNLQTVMRSIAAFVQVADCLPCPTPAEDAAGEFRGIVRGDSTLNPPSCGTCSTSVGVLPFRSLGLTESFAKDAYGHWLTYAVDNNLTKVFPAVAPATVAKPVDNNGLCQAVLSSASAIKVYINGSSNPQNNIAIMLLSHGANGRGAYRNAPEPGALRMNLPTTACSSSAGAELCNADDNLNFVAGLPAQGSDPFDDVYLYLDRNALVTYLGNQPCTTEWK